MFQSLRLSLAFEFLATKEEWAWFGPMVGRDVLHWGYDGWPRFPLEQIRDYQALWTILADAAQEKLKDGDWTAKGISPAFGGMPVPIDTMLWEYLRIKDRLEEAEGWGFHFVALTVTDRQLPKVEVSQASKQTLRAQLIRWIQAQAAAQPVPLLRAEQLAAARAAFEGVEISDNLFRDCRRAAGLAETSVQRGRPKAKGSGK